MSTPLTCGTMFSGGGGWDLGAMAAGYTPVWAIECESPIADCYEANIGQHVIRDFVQCVDPSELRRVDLLCASPVCKSFSTANPAGGEHEIDIVCARAVAHFLRVLSPPAFCLENVAAYAKSRSMDIIREALQDVYGWWDEAVHNAADYGVPQTRKRFIVRANGGAVAPLPKASRRIGWYQAIEDLIPTLPPSEFAPWQLERLPKAFTGNRMLPVHLELTISSPFLFAPRANLSLQFAAQIRPGLFSLRETRQGIDAQRCWKRVKPASPSRQDKAAGFTEHYSLEGIAG
jgi:site-specific DNA-cytosine methylase